jgi:hypothetical protein
MAGQELSFQGFVGNSVACSDFSEDGWASSDFQFQIAGKALIVSPRP